jgi:hypothetical protein
MLRWLFEDASNRAEWRLAKQLARQKPKPLYLSSSMLDVAYRVVPVGPVNAEPEMWRRCLLMVDAVGITIYPQTPQMDARRVLPVADWRWFGRPQKYEQGENELWLHVETHDLWHVIQIRMQYSRMQKLVRALKVIAPAPLTTAYRRQRPYIHYGPRQAFPAEQDLYGAWTVLPEPLRLYITPLWLVIFNGAHVERCIPLEQLQEIAALRRMDAPGEDGVTRFKIIPPDMPAPEQAETLAFTLADYYSFGEALAEAAKRSLEDPIMVKKKKDSDDGDDED